MTRDPALLDLTLSGFLASSRLPLGTLTVAGADLAALIAAETDVPTLHKAAARAAETNDRRWQIAIFQRLFLLAPHEDIAAVLCDWLIDAGQPDAAGLLVDQIAGQRPGPRDPERANRLCLRLDLARGAFAKVAAELGSGPFDLGRYIDSGWAFMSGGAWDLLADLLARARQEAPQADAVAVLGLRCRSLFDGPALALADLIRDDGPLRKGTLLYCEQQAQLLAEIGRFSEALDLVEATIRQHPTRWALYGMAESLAAQSDRSDTLERILSQALRLFPGQPEILARAVNLAADTSHTVAAEALLAELRALSDWGWHEARIGALCQTGDQAQIALALAEAQAADLPSGAAELVTAGYHYFFRSDGDGLDLAAALVAPLAGQFAHDSGYQCLRLRLLLALGREAEALAAYAALPPGLASTTHLAPFRFLADVKAKDETKARKGWSEHLARSGHIALNAASAYPETVSLKWRGGSSDVLLFAVIFNGAEFIDFFLNHYRALGVDHFFMVDNGSTDGTYQALLQQPDVSVFRQTSSFRAAGCGIFWINHLIRRFGVGHWCFQVDMDEAFVFPHMEQGRGLRDFLSFVAAQGWSSVPAMMLDMYPATLGDATTANSFAESRYFDLDYRSFPNELPPYRFIQGGIRARLSGRSLMMTKAPLVRPTANFAYLANNHQHTHLPISEVTGALLHYKFIGNLRLRVDEAIEREEHFMGARFYRALRDPIAAPDGPTQLLSKHSMIYQSPQDLLRAGLMQSSSAWDHWHDVADLHIP